MKTGLQDTTFIIPLRVDTVMRLENLLMTVDLLHEHFDTKIVVMEAACYNSGIVKSLLKGKASYVFLEDKDPVFYKTRYLNLMAKEVKTPITGLWDVDMVIDPAQVLDAVGRLRTGQCDVAYPYNGDFYDTSDIFRSHYLQHRDIGFLTKHTAKMNRLYAVEGVIGAVGGIVMVKTDRYLLSGMDNEQFYGWGLEDGERHYRWLGFDYRICRSEGCLFHLSHPRDSNGMFRSKVHHEKARHDMDEIANYTKEELHSKFSGEAGNSTKS